MKFLRSLALVLASLVFGGVAVAAPAYYTPVASVSGLAAFGSASASIRHAQVALTTIDGVTGSSGYSWVTPCSGSPDGARYVAATGVAVGCWVSEGVAGSDPNHCRFATLSAVGCVAITPYPTPAHNVATSYNAATGYLTFSQLGFSDLSGTAAINQGGTSATTAAGARAALGVSATGADTTYAFRANNLSDLPSAATARANLNAMARTAAGASILLKSDGAGDTAAYTGSGTCAAGTFPSVMDNTGGFTCTSFPLAGSYFANQGTSVQLLHGNASGNPSWGAINLATAQVTGVLGATNGGTGTTTPVTSVFGRTGAVVAATNDYSFPQISGSVAASQLPLASLSAVGAVAITPYPTPAHNVATSYNAATGYLTFSQLGFSDLSGTLDPSQCPIPTGTAVGCVKDPRTVGSVTFFPTPITDTGFQVVGAATLNPVILIDSYAGTPNIICRRADQSIGFPSAVQNGDVLCNFGGRGFGATDYSATSRGYMRPTASENWTDVAQGTYLSFGCTPNGGTATAECGRLTNTGMTINGSAALLASNIGATVQAWDTDLDQFAALTGAADKVPYYTGAHAMAVADFTSTARSLLDDTSIPAMLTTLGASPPDLFANPSFDVWQENVTYSPNTGVQTFVADRWKMRSAATATNGTRTVSRATGFSGAQYGLKMQRVAANAEAGIIAVGQQIFSADSIPLQSKTLHLACDVSWGANFSPTTMTAILFYGTGVDELVNYSTGFATGGATSNFSTSPAASPGNITHADFGTVSVSSTETEAAVRIGTGAFVGTAGADDSATITNCNLTTTAGDVPFTKPTFRQNMEAAQFTFRKSFLYATVPAQNVGTGTGEFRWPAAVAGVLTDRATIVFGQAMFGVPTITLYNPAAANAQCRDETAAADCASTAAGNITEKGFEITGLGNVATVAGSPLGIHYTADKRE